MRCCLAILFLFFFTEILADQWNGSDYAQNSSVQLSHAERLLLNLSLQGNEKILDIGCGDGKITALLSGRVPEGFVIGVDPSISMLTKAEEVRKESGAANLAFCEGFAEDFLFNEHFDHIVAIHVMHWVKEQEKALKNIYAHLKPKGHVHFILAPSKEGLPFYRALQNTLSTWDDNFNGFVNPQQVFDMETYRRLMVEAGFHIEAIHYVYHESIHANKERLKAWVKQWQPHGKYLSATKQDIFLDELINNYLIEIGFSLETLNPVPWGEYVLIVEAAKL
jgi:trans-aconitate 2-methyltransferase